MANWFDGTVNDDLILAKTDKLKNTKKGKKLVIFTGSYALQYIDYMKAFTDPNCDTMIMNFCHLIPGAENADWYFHGSMGYIKAFAATPTFKYFCQKFNGAHVVMTQTNHCAGGAYPIAPKADTINMLKTHNIKNWYIATHAHGDKFKSAGFGYIPPDLNTFTPSKIPWGCGGTLNAMALPFALQLGYSKIYLVGVGDQIRAHFYSVDYIQPHLRKPVNLPYRDITLRRYSGWNALAKKNGTELFAVPTECVEPSVRKVLPTLKEIP